MDRRGFMMLAGGLAAQLALPSHRVLAESAPAAAPSLPNPFLQEGRWFKAAFHAHTTTSDGNVDVPTRLAQYRERGYQVVAITDHWKTNDLSQYAEENFLPIVGMEFHPRTQTGAPSHHFVALNLPHPFELDRNLPAQQMVDAVLATGAVVIYAHPYWTAHSIAEMLEVTGYSGVEVFNAGCELECGRGHSSVHWDQLLNKGRIVGGLATDDVHGEIELNRGWTMIKAPSLDVASIMKAVREGAYYASAGPEILDCRIEEGVIRVTTGAVQEIKFVVDGAGGGHVARAKAGETITSAEWTFGTSRRKYRWIRVEVIDEQGNHAWTNPLLLPPA